MPSSRFMRRFLVAAGRVGFGALAALLIVNLIDETLSPEAAAFYESGRLPALAEAHGFALLVGLNAPVDQDPRAFAVAWSRKVANAARLKLPAPVYTDALQVFGASELRCNPRAENCIAKYGVNPRSIDDVAADNAVLLGRYRELARETNLSDAFDAPESDAPRFDIQNLIAAQSLVLSQVAASVARGNVDMALLALEQDATFYRLWLTQATTLISKFVAANGLGRDVLLALQIARHLGNPTPSQKMTLNRLVAPLTPREMALGPAVRLEASLLPMHIDHVVKNRREMQAATESGQLMSHLLALSVLRNATLNVAYQPLSLIAHFDFGDSAGVDAQIDAWRREFHRVVTPGWDWLYNPAGRIFLARALGGDEAEWQGYIVRVRDFDAHSRLACVVVEVLLNRVASQDIEAHLAKSDPRCHDPYTGKPMRWDAASGTLWFKPADPSNVKRFGGADGRVGLRVYQ